MEGLMGAAKDAMGGGEAPPHDPAEAEAAINAEADKAGAAGNSDLMAKLKAAATNRKIQGAFMDVKNNGVSAAMKYKDDAERGRGVPVILVDSSLDTSIARRHAIAAASSRCLVRAGSRASSRTCSCRERGTHDAYGRRRRMSEVSTSKYPEDDERFPTTSAWGCLLVSFS